MLHYLIIAVSLSYLSCVGSIDGRQPYNCPSDGRFNNPENRVSYILCEYGIPTVVDCPVNRYGSRQWPLVFNGRECVEPWECPEIDGTYRQTNRGYALFMCMDGQPSQYTCPAGSTFEGRGCACDSGSPCIHGSFECPENGLFNNPYSRTSFVECVEGRPYVKFCRQFTTDKKQWSLVFDGEKCVQPFQCPEIDNTFKRVHSGRVYYKCKDGVPEEYHCTNGTSFDGRGCRPPSISQINQRPPHFRILVQNRHLIKFEFANKVVTDTFDTVSWRWRRTVEYNDII